ncbi:hypothetical protein ACTMTI_52395 [Nonomuraea sp. H19]
MSDDAPSRREDMIKSIAAVLVAQAMNVGMRPHPARLAWSDHGCQQM